MALNHDAPQRGPDTATQGQGPDLFMSDEALASVLRGVQAAHPEQLGVIRAFTPLLLTRNRLLREAPPAVPAPAAAAGTACSVRLGELPFTADAAHAVALAVLEAMEEGIPDQGAACAAIRRCLEPAHSQRLCAAWFAVAAPKGELKGARAEGQVVSEAESWAGRRGLSAESLVFMLAQTCRILASLAVAGLPQAHNDGMARYCPCCGGRPELSVIHGTDGRRALVCGVCGRSWRFRRTMCPACGHEAPGNLRDIHVEGRPEERGVSCTACGRYVLEVDIRALDLMPEHCHALALGLGHLDFLLQEEGSVPLSRDFGE